MNTLLILLLDRESYWEQEDHAAVFNKEKH